MSVVGRERGQALVLGALLLLATAVILRPWELSAAQQQGARSRSGVYTAAVEMVRVPVVVVDAAGSFIPDLTGSDFAVQDGGRTHPIEHFVSEAEPTTVGILLDASAAMASYADDVRRTAVQLAYQLRPDNELFLIAFGAGVETLSPLSTDRVQFAAAVEQYRVGSGGDRALHDAVGLGLSHLEEASYDKRTLILIGVGGDTSSSLGEATLQQRIHRTGVAIHAIALAARGTGRRTEPARVGRLQTLPELVRYTGGLVARRPRIEDRFGGFGAWLGTAVKDISRYVNHQYLLHYTPLNPPRNGAWRTIRVRVDVAFDHVRARSGYVR